MRWRSQAYATHDEGMLFEKTTCHRPKAFADAEVFFVRNLKILRPTFAAFAHRKNWVTALSVRFRHVAQSNLHPQRMSASRQ